MQKGSLARVEPEGQVMRMWEAIETYMNRKQNRSSSPVPTMARAARDWAAKGVRLAGVEVIVAEGFERIHRTNLVGMGVLPVEFAGHHAPDPGLDGTETFDIEGELSPRCDLTWSFTTTTVKKPVPVTCRLDTAAEVSVPGRRRAAAFRQGLPRQA